MSDQYQLVRGGPRCRLSGDWNHLQHRLAERHPISSTAERQDHLEDYMVSTVLFPGSREQVDQHRWRLATAKRADAQESVGRAGRKSRLVRRGNPLRTGRDAISWLAPSR